MEYKARNWKLCPQFMELKQQLIAFEKFVRSFFSRKNNSKCMERKVKKRFSFIGQKKKGDQMLWMMKLCKRSEMF